MNILIIGGSGHIGGFLTDLLVEDGHEVVVMASGRTPPRNGTELIAMLYPDALKDGSFQALLRQRQFDGVVDILQGDIAGVYSACAANEVSHLVACGSLWMFGRPKTVPTPEAAQTECPFEDYQQRFQEMRNVLERSKTNPCAFSAIMPPNICGPGKIPLDGHGGRSPFAPTGRGSHTTLSGHQSRRSL
jgi:nucleoside-diphosphate-sugar epimerase